jgi:hypothetical protein
MLLMLVPVVVAVAEEVCQILVVVLLAAVAV